MSFPFKVVLTGLQWLRSPVLICLHWLCCEIRQTWPLLLDMSSISVNCLTLTEGIAIILTVFCDLGWHWANPAHDWISPWSRSGLIWGVLLRCSASNSAPAWSARSQCWCVYAASPFPLGRLHETISMRIQWCVRPQNSCMVGTCWQFIHTEH